MTAIRSRIRCALALALAMPLASPGLLSAAVPKDMTVQGRLVDEAGRPLPGPIAIDIGIWDSPLAGNERYGETHPAVALRAGVFALVLGSGSNPRGFLDEATFSSPNRYLEIKVGGDVLTPRQPFSSVPYAFVAARIDGFAANQLQQRVSAPCPAGSAIQAIQSNGTVSCQTGGVQSVGAGAGLTGGGSGPATVSLSIPAGGITSGMLQPGSVTTGSVQDGSLTADDMGASVQRRVTGSCAVGSTIRAINADGTVLCEPMSGDVTAVMAGLGLVGGSESGAAVLSIGTKGVTGDMLADGSVTGLAIADNSVASVDIQTDSIGSSELKDNSVLAAHLTDSSVGSAEITDNSVSSLDLRTDSVGPAELQDGSVDRDHLDLDVSVGDEVVANAIVGDVQDVVGRTFCGLTRTTLGADCAIQVLGSGAFRLRQMGGNCTGIVCLPSCAMVCF